MDIDGSTVLEFSKRFSYVGLQIDILRISVTLHYKNVWLRIIVNLSVLLLHGYPSSFRSSDGHSMGAITSSGVPR